MKLFEITQPILLEGGKALKGVSEITQAEVKTVTPDLLKHVQMVLNLVPSKVKLIGSAGKKNQADDLSGDIDIAVECDSNLVNDNIKELAGNHSSRIMKGIGVFSIAYPVSNKLVQVDLIPVNNINFAEWSYQANPDDLAQGLKGAQRNELFFAIAKYMPQTILKKDDKDEPLEIERYFYDLARGLMVGVRSRVNANGKIGKNFITIEKKVVTDDPVKICKLMFGVGVTPRQTSTFNGTLAAIKKSSFIHKNVIDKILDLAKTGIKNKKLKMPTSI